MNKTVTINLSSIIFHIDEDAYEKLGKYLTAIKSFFKDSDGKEEIMADIESRIAEMFSEKTRNNKQVISISDVDHVIEVMGKPEEFAGEDSHDHQKGNSANTSSYNNRRKRVFRDPDNRIVGGVCSGVSEYFGLDPLWLRIAFVCSLVFFGTGLLLYIILWILIPEAKTASEKLEMRGENVNYENIGKTINEELNHLKKKVEDFGKEASSTLGSEQNKKKVKVFTEKFVGFCVVVFGSLFKALAKFIGLILAITGIVLISLLIASVFGEANFVHIYNGEEDAAAYSIKDLFHVFLANENQVTYLIIGLLLVIGIPLISMIYGGIKLLLGITTSNKVFSFLLTSLWFIGIIILAYISYIIATNFSVKESYKETIYTAPYGLTQLTVDADKNLSEARPDITMGHWNLIKQDGEVVSFCVPKLNIIKSETENFELQLIQSSYGSSNKEASRLAKQIQYDFVGIDSLIKFQPYFTLNKEEKWRNQQVKLVLKVPRGKTIFISENMKDIIYDIDNVTNTLDKDMVNRRWVMTEDGLECVDCDGIENRLEGKNNFEKAPAPPTPPLPPIPKEDGIVINSGESTVRIDKSGIHVEDSSEIVKVTKDGVKVHKKK